ncbi:cadherin-related tumor suppressor-like [Babylonia areolata]|uniref:cadherin-related tumor suppressor-like n=1 Tax=Babylonia areolata TaxID=304850 RepID=UPI003FD5092C
MATLKTPGGLSCSRAVSHSVCILLLLFLGQFARGQGPGGGGNSRIYMTVTEERSTGVVVGVLPVKTGYVYELNADELPLFELDDSGTIRTRKIIDREALPSDTINLFVAGRHPSEPTHLLEVTISVLDINDNAPRFDEAVVSESFQEDARPGQQQLIVTATDPDKGQNGTIVEYRIVSGNEDGKFSLTPPSEETPFLFIVTKDKLDRESKDFYQLNISAKDNGATPLYGYLQLNIDITDVNDNPPVFDQSEYVTHIKEGTSVDTSVIRVEATDFDIGENAQIDYFLTDSSGQFQIDRDTGVIRTLRSPLECSRPSCGSQQVNSMVECDPNSCLLTVEARDRGSTPQDGRAYIYVSIIDENDHDPVITFEPVAPDPVTGAATTDENASGLRVATISVTDMDRGMNGQTTVQIILGNEADHFRLISIPTPQNTVNYIQVKGSLDRETIPQYNLTFRAVDKGSPPRSSTAYLIIIVNDANDHTPVFQQEEYFARLSELAVPGSFVAGVKAVDEDSGPNSQLTYTILAGNEQGWFSIDDATGLVTTRVALDHEVADRVVLNISAHDSGATPYRNFTKMVVDILDENDMAPQFRNILTRVELDENKPENQNVATLTADDFDSGSNGTVFYHLHPDTELLYPGVFQVGRTSGSVSTLISLDREAVPSYTIKVIAKDGGSPSLSSTATIILKVRDLNDNVPVFHPSSYFVNVFETDPAGVEVVQVSAIDRDVGAYGKVSYSFTGSAFNKFSIDSNTGIITTNTVLRRTSGSSYQLSVVAKDGSDRRSERAATVTIIVARISDPAPTFTNQRKTFNINEDFGSQTSPSTLGQTVGQVQATGGGGSGITYFIASGDPYEVFSIDSSGFIKRNKLVDREEKGQYVLKVVASTGSKFGEMSVTINVRDVNDNSPHFIATTSETTVMENWPVGNNIFLAAAEDSDANANALLVYTIRSDDDVNGVFGIDQNTGIISLQKPTAQLQGNQVMLTVTVRDSGTPQRTDSIDIVVKIQDVNDHTPFFPRNVYSVYILESRPVNENIMKLVASDIDEGRNGELVYKIMRGNEEGRFGIFPDGTIFIAHTLDRETRDMYSLMIQVQDCGDRPRSSTANVTIYVLDANDNSPAFANSSYVFSVPENRPGGTFVGSIKAYDHDVGVNAELVFSLTEGNANFTIDPITGAIYTRRPFDREYVMDTSSVEFYTVDVFATDGGNPKLRGKSTVRVFISDVNDNPPVFGRALFSAAVPENAVQNTKVIKMTATDADIGANGAITYVITEGNEGNRFTIAETTGEITVAGKLDRETRDHYMLTVVATDTGSGAQLSSSAQVSITVMDTNDNPPQFTSTERQLSVEETKPIGELLTVFSGKDLDQGNNAKMYFSIYSGNDDDVFNLDGYTGKLYLVRQLDYETRQEYLLNVSVTDEGYHPSLSSYIFFRVRVVDTNDNAPQFTDGFKSINPR